MADDDLEDDALFCVGVGACHELSSKPKRSPRKKNPIGFIHNFPQTQPAKKPQPRPAAKTRRTRRK